jgi:hypothetical protein
MMKKSYRVRLQDARKFRCVAFEYVGFNVDERVKRKSKINGGVSDHGKASPVANLEVQTWIAFEFAATFIDTSGSQIDTDQ